VVDEVLGDEGQLGEVAEDQLGIEGDRSAQRRPRGEGANDVGFGSGIPRGGWLSSRTATQRRTRRPQRLRAGSSSALDAWSRKVSRGSRGVERGGSNLCFSTKACSG
jgi:hypothetical protein